MTKGTRKAAKAATPAPPADSYDPELAERICAGMMEGRSVRDICTDAGMPHRATIYRWLASHTDFQAAYTFALKVREEDWAAELVEIADTPLEGVETTTKPNGDVETKKGDMLGHRKLQVDTRKWVLSRMNPKKYGERTAIVGGGEGEAPIAHAIDVSGLKPDQLRALASIKLPADA